MFIVNLDKVEFVDSTGLGVLVGGLSRVRPAGNNGTLIGGSGLGVDRPPHRQNEPAPIRTASGVEGRSPDELAMPSRVAGLRFRRRMPAAR